MLAGVTQQLDRPALVRIPVEVATEAAVFSPAGRGYDRKQVDAHVAALEQELAELRWEHEDLAGQRQALFVQRAQQACWTPSFTALGERVVQLVRLAEEKLARYEPPPPKTPTANVSRPLPRSPHRPRGRPRPWLRAGRWRSVSCEFSLTPRSTGVGC